MAKLNQELRDKLVFKESEDGFYKQIRISIEYRLHRQYSFVHKDTEDIDEVDKLKEEAKNILTQAIDTELKKKQ